MSPEPNWLASALQRLRDAASDKHLSSPSLNPKNGGEAYENIKKWLEGPEYDLAVKQVIVEHLERGDWTTLEDAFCRVIPFGTGGRRGRVYPIGCNFINDRTIGESAQGVADYIHGVWPLIERVSPGTRRACAIAYDPRQAPAFPHITSRHFAELCAEIMAQNGFLVYFLDEPRSTPELSFLTRAQRCACGIMVTASHNPPQDNAVKVYNWHGCQVTPPHDQGIIDRVKSVTEIRRKPFDQAWEHGQIVICTAETDGAYLAAVAGQRLGGPRNLRVLYSNLHGVGEASVAPALRQAGFTRTRVFAPHRERDGAFPNVFNHVSNPQEPKVFDVIIEEARRQGDELIIATDPDCDRMGCATPLTWEPNSPWKVLDGNSIGALLTDFALRRLKLAGALTHEHFVAKTLVTTELVRRVAEARGARCEGELLVGFKWIGQLVDELGPDKFVIGIEESHGYLVGGYARDKDGAVASLLIAEAAAAAKAEGRTLHQALDNLYVEHGCHAEDAFDVKLPGAEGMALMKKLLDGFRKLPPVRVAGLAERERRDYLTRVGSAPEGDTWPLAQPKTEENFLIYELETQGNYFAVRPSGTEPKVKFYLFARNPPAPREQLESEKRAARERLEGMKRDLRQLADMVLGK